MPNFNARIRTHIDKDGKANIKIRVTHKRVSRFIPTEYYIEPHYFDNDTGRVKPSHPNAIDLNIELQALELTYSRKLLKLESRLRTIEVDEIVQFINDTDKQGALDFYAVARKHVDHLLKLGKTSSSKLLDLTIKQVKKYHAPQVLPFVSITQAWLKGFESWYCMGGSQNSAAIHLRNIRTLYNKAVDEHNLSPEFYPFRKFKIKTKQTIHRDLSKEEVALLVAYSPRTKAEELARDMWLLSFYLCGINFKDLLLARRIDVKRGRLVYSRAKTSTIYSVKIEGQAEAILRKYRGEKYLLSIMESKEAAQEKKDRSTPLYKDITDQVNRTLKKIALAINTNEDKSYTERIEPALSTYYARHSWGTIASRLDVAHDVIREALGHGRSVTDIYINFYTGRIDQANKAIITACQPAG